MDPEHLAFQGHFPGQPILPGVVQMDWATQFGTLAYGALGRFLGVEHLKFLGLILPNETVGLNLRFDAKRGRLRFTFAVGTNRKSTGTILFEPRS
jgi:3-hydroxymyristoyl/3-hydroxydecanoyl-(acyl carrier protein) dehydratase